jgi:hypothetical protein
MTNSEPGMRLLWLNVEADLLAVPAEVAYEIAATDDPARVKEILCTAFEEVFARFHAAAQLVLRADDEVVH